jgi:hypothetical protein
VRALDRILQDSNITGYVVAIEREQFKATMTVMENLCGQMLYCTACRSKCPASYARIHRADGKVDDNYRAVKVPSRDKLELALEARFPNRYRSIVTEIQTLPGLVVGHEPFESAIPGPFGPATMYPPELSGFVAIYTAGHTAGWAHRPMILGGHPMEPNHSGSSGYTPASSPCDSGASSGPVYTPTGTPTAGSPTADGPAFAGSPAWVVSPGVSYARGPALAGGNPDADDACHAHQGACSVGGPFADGPVVPGAAAGSRQAGGSHAGVPLFAGNRWADMANQAFGGGGPRLAGYADGRGVVAFGGN